MNSSGKNSNQLDSCQNTKCRNILYMSRIGRPDVLVSVISHKMDSGMWQKMSKADFQQVVPVDGKCFQYLPVSFFPGALHLIISRDLSDLSNCTKKDQKIVNILTSNEDNGCKTTNFVSYEFLVSSSSHTRDNSTVTQSTSAELCENLNLTENVIFKSTEFGCQNFLLRMQQNCVENEWVFNILLKPVIFFVTWNWTLRCLTLANFLCFFAFWIKKRVFHEDKRPSQWLPE